MQDSSICLDVIIAGHYTTMVWPLINHRRSCTCLMWHSATIIGTKMFVFGGQEDQGVYYNNLSVFDPETNCWLSTCLLNNFFHKGAGVIQLLYAQNGDYIHTSRVQLQSETR